MKMSTLKFALIGMVLMLATLSTMAKAPPPKVLIEKPAIMPHIKYLDTHFSAVAGTNIFYQLHNGVGIVTEAVNLANKRVINTNPVPVSITAYNFDKKATEVAMLPTGIGLQSLYIHNYKDTKAVITCNLKDTPTRDAVSYGFKEPG